MDQGNLTQAAALAQESLTLARNLNNKPDITNALFCLANSAEYQGEYAQAEVLTLENLALVRKLGDKYRIVSRIDRLRRVCNVSGRLLAVENIP